MMTKVGIRLVLLVAIGATIGCDRVTRHVGLFVGGGASNLLDRIVHGAVIDFMNVGIGPLRTGIFNVADMAIMLGVAIVLLEPGRPADRHRHKARG